MAILELLSSRGQQSYVRTLATGKWVRLLPGQRVRVEGRKEEFVVLRVDQKLQVADLIRSGSMSKVEMDIPILMILGVREPNPEDDGPEVA